MRKKRNPFSNYAFLTVVAVLSVLLVVAVIVLSGRQEICRTVTVEAGSAAVSPQQFAAESADASAVAFVTDMRTIDLKKCGEYPIEVRYKDKTYTSLLVVKDTIAPTAQTVDTTVLKGATADAADFVRDVQDVTAVTVSFAREPKTTAVGKQTVTVVLADEAGNKTKLDATLHVVEDVTPPQIIGVQAMTVYAGSTVNYRKGITVKDDFDATPVLTVDSHDVDVSKLGTYTVTYTATDASGNAASKTAAVHVKMKPITGSITTEDKKLLAQDMADKKLDTLVHSGMTATQKVQAIYNWARGNVGYSGKSDKSDYLVEAYNTLKTGATDCYGYFAVTKLMFERLGIPNIDVVKVKNTPDDASHFWSLVSVDGGKTYYHFDATPRKGEGDDFCLVTDAFLDAYSDAHQKCHNRDKSLYPATPAQ